LASAEALLKVFEHVVHACGVDLPLPADFRWEDGILVPDADVFCCGLFLGGEVFGNGAFGRLMVMAFDDVIGGG